jgi:hypothetical protein
MSATVDSNCSGRWKRAAPVLNHASSLEDLSNWLKAVLPENIFASLSLDNVSVQQLFACKTNAVRASRSVSGSEPRGARGVPCSFHLQHVIGHEACLYDVMSG